jgi:acyl-CoA reductase-like NAD-dependent aldehyde dehydrogenase
VDELLSDPKRAAEVLGAIQNEATLRRVGQAANDRGVSVLRPASPVVNEQFPQARTCSPLILRVDAGQRDLYMREMFGPISYLIATDDTRQSITLAAETARELGAITWAAYATDTLVVDSIDEAALEAGVACSFNLTGPIYVNQAAAFSDYHVSGCNPSGNATLCDAAFVAPRFRIVQSRRPAPSAATIESKPAAASAVR